MKKRLRRIKQNIMRKVYGSLYKPGHFYSTIPAQEDYEHRIENLLSKSAKQLPGVDLNFEGQCQLLEACKEFYAEAGFPNEKTEGWNYYYKNIYFVAPDAISLYLMLRYIRPKRVVEVGSGFSSAVIIDTNEKYFDGQIQCTFIEPYPDRLNWFLSKNPNPNYKLLEQKVQDVPLEVFTSLEANDLLLIDSSHVSKLGSDVNFLFFNVLPSLHKGVVVHVHDVMYPFEYPLAWIREKRFWNEAYLLRAYLTHNDACRILLFNSYMTIHHKEWLKSNMPILANAEGGSIYFQKIK